MTYRRKLLLNSTNLHHGGAVQVAASVVFELSRISKLPPELVVWASDAVDLELRKLNTPFNNLIGYEVVNTYGIKLQFSSLRKRFCEFDAIYTIFGPFYLWNYPGFLITGFAQPHIVSPLRISSNGLLERFLNKLRFNIQVAFFRRADHLVVELDHVRRGLLNRHIGTPSSISVVHNCLSSLYSEPASWEPVFLPASNADIRLGFLGRNYPHKNTRIFPAVIDELYRRFGLRVSIYVTFNSSEWSACDEEFRRKIINVGSLFLAQCPSFYQQIDAVIFPSLLECFSATPLEAMAMEKPLFASDRPFNRDVCGPHAYYFDPLSPISAAESIAQVFLRGSCSLESLRLAREHSIGFSSPQDRANRYLDLLTSAVTLSK